MSGAGGWVSGVGCRVSAKGVETRDLASVRRRCCTGSGAEANAQPDRLASRSVEMGIDLAGLLEVAIGLGRIAECLLDRSGAIEEGSTLDTLSDRGLDGTLGVFPAASATECPGVGVERVGSAASLQFRL
ncbi:MAG: hypothetical protein HC895_21515 [Leptolyngbyaceae cyanobacterium SM1_3_5]|nr:hypothetical protein [Leptolyngbyaceae cyanobacterium SM1_3_5]